MPASLDRTGHAGPGGRQGVGRLAWLMPALVAVLAAAGCGTAASGATQATAGLTAKCQAAQSSMLATVPGFVTLFRQAVPALPGDPGAHLSRPQESTQYVCGESNGFVADDMMHGKYRAQDNALARSLGYTLGRLPLLPYIGPAVTTDPHGVFEAYESAYGFRSVTAAGKWLTSARRTPVRPDDLTVPLPPSFIARTDVFGPNDGRHEHRIGISGLIGTTAVVVSFNGGRGLSWRDIQAIWQSAYSRLRHCLGSAAKTA
ncbi:MAG TPA: hypothetical protein VGS19_15400 [Streptosporangiaceae bacterium]|nr:hypothetical protein [Streptosporangiaceae bacterium]